MTLNKQAVTAAAVFVNACTLSLLTIPLQAVECNKWHSWKPKSFQAFPQFGGVEHVVAWDLTINSFTSRNTSGNDSYLLPSQGGFGCFFKMWMTLTRLFTPLIHTIHVFTPYPPFLSSVTPPSSPLPSCLFSLGPCGRQEDGKYFCWIGVPISHLPFFFLQDIGGSGRRWLCADLLPQWGQKVLEYGCVGAGMWGGRWTRNCLA